MNLFKAAKEKGATASPKVQKQEIVIKDAKFHLNLSRLVEVNRQIDELSAESTILSAEVKERSIQEFINLYNNEGKYPGSFLIKAEGMKKTPVASLMFIPTDKYIKIGEDRYNELTEEFGEHIVTEKTTYTMNADLIEKYGEIISDLIGNCKKIDEEDKKKLISAVTSYEVTKGTISELTDEKYKKFTVEHMLTEIKPVYQVKNLKLEE